MSVQYNTFFSLLQRYILSIKTLNIRHIFHMKHAWNVTPTEAVKIQKELRDLVQIQPLERTLGARPIKLLAAADVSMNLYSKTIYAGFVLMTYPELEVIDHSVVKEEAHFPYIPGLLSFREIPALLNAWEKLKNKRTKADEPMPDLIIVDGMGIAHPRRLGIATHLGILLDIPTIGSAKSLLTGVHNELGDEAGNLAYLHDAIKTEEIIGAVLRTKRGIKPIYVSPGHKITLEESVKIIFSCIRKHRLPDPIRFAHEKVNEYRRRGLND